MKSSDFTENELYDLAKLAFIIDRPNLIIISKERLKSDGWVDEVIFMIDDPDYKKRRQQLSDKCIDKVLEAAQVMLKLKQHGRIIDDKTDETAAWQLGGWKSEVAYEKYKKWLGIK